MVNIKFKSNTTNNNFFSGLEGNMPVYVVPDKAIKTGNLTSRMQSSFRDYVDNNVSDLDKSTGRIYIHKCILNLFNQVHFLGLEGNMVGYAGFEIISTNVTYS